MKQNPLDRATLPNWLEFGKKNWGYIALIGSFLGYNVMQPKPELPPVVKAPDVAFTAMEFQQLITGFQTSCQTEVDKWRPKKKRK